MPRLRVATAQGGDSGEAERSYGIGLKLFGFIAESVFTFIPESCSRSSRNTVRNHPGKAFTLPRIPQSEGQNCRVLAVFKNAAQIDRNEAANIRRIFGALRRGSSAAGAA